MSTPWLRCAGAVCAVCLLASCATGDKMHTLAQLFQRSEEQVDKQRQAFDSVVASRDARRASQEVDRPWLAGRPVPLARELTLPPALRARVSTTLIFSDAGLDLSQVAQRITLATDIPVYVSPEALLPAEHFLPRLSNLQGAGAASGPVLVVLQGGAEPLARTLDRICAQLGVLWRYTDERIEFYRTETRVFNVRALTLDANTEASLGQGSTSDSGGFSSTSRTVLSSAPQDAMAVVRARLEPFLSRAGTLVAESGAASLVVVTDTPQVLQRIAQYLDQENKAMTRRIRLIFEEVTLAQHDDAEIGLDWNLIFSGSRIAASLVVPGSALAESARLGLGITSGSFQDSEAIVKALGEIGRIVRHTRVPVLTMNRRPVTHAVRTTFSYIDKVETTAVPTGTGSAVPAVSVSQKDETVGSLLTLVPDAQEDGQILLSVAYDNTVAQPLKSVTFGDRANPLQLQQITIDGNGTVQQVVLQPGQPLVISGFDRAQHESTARRLNPGMPLLLGGADSAVSRQLTTLVLITAQMEEGY